ncbi:hypothetical protein [Geminisphaera colitermitum]|uniref:hypothetical protein n=1 Tax=Geminisphaera colitermitum TaxID=1148786 RepID=UPI0001964F27|nr:hypothetical protein [Geminisphaera colitermitum]
MIYRILFLITTPLAPLALNAQTLPPPAFVTVAANPDGTLRAPASFWPANAAAIATAIGYDAERIDNLAGQLEGFQSDLQHVWNNRQPLDSTLTALSGKTISPFAYTLLDDTDAATVRNTLGLGTAATTASTAYATSAQGTLAATAVQPARTITAAGLATGGGDLTANRTITVAAATDPQAIAGTASNVAMTPASTRTAIDARSTVAVFTIPLGPGFYDFELKATLSNFGEHTPFTDLIFYYHSPDPARTSITSQIGAVPTVFFTDTGNSDKRRWRKQPANKSIWQTRAGIVPAVIVVVPLDATIKQTNPNLIWSYQRITATTYEDIWYPIIPTWLPVAPTP